jgi:FlaA1/EpsC-like NDP-sugar epimerase
MMMEHHSLRGKRNLERLRQEGNQSSRKGRITMSTVLVTGGTGALGRAVVARLLVRHHHVRLWSHRTDSQALIRLGDSGFLYLIREFNKRRLI